MLQMVYPMIKCNITWIKHIPAFTRWTLSVSYYYLSSEESSNRFIFFANIYSKFE
jgi:hypothetical protein